jgi:hypothetical protein
MIKKLLFSILFFSALSNCLQAQIITVSPGTNLTIKSGTVFFADNIIFTPSADFTLSNISLSRNLVATHSVLNPYIARVYQFSGNTNPFSGSVQINYQDGAELNGLSENTLQLNVNDGTNWQVFSAAANDVVNNFVLTTSLSNNYLNELTLAASGFPLPLQWRSFTAAKQEENVLLDWSTFSEQNTKYFTIQTSTNSTAWKTLGTVAAAGNSSSAREYSFLHLTPVAGYNYYRIVETDMDGRQNYSVVRNIFFQLPPFRVELLGNPVTDGILQVKIDMANPNACPPMLKLYTADGKLLGVKQAGGGINTLNVNSYPKGTYLLQVNEKAIKFLIQ